MADEVAVPVQSAKSEAAESPVGQPATNPSPCHVEARIGDKELVCDCDALLVVMRIGQHTRVVGNFPPQERAIIGTAFIKEFEARLNKKLIVPARQTPRIVS